MPKEKIKITKQKKTRTNYIKRYRNDYWFRSMVDLCASLVINIVYSLWEIVCGLAYGSNWFVAFGAYYLVLVAIRLMLVFSLYRRGLNQQEGWREYRLTGVLIFIINLLLIVVVLLVFMGDVDTHIPTYSLYIIGIYAGYRIIASIYKLIRYRHSNTPILTSANVIYYVGSLITAFSFVISAMVRFSESEFLVNLVVGASGFIFFLAIAGAAIFMIIRSGTYNWVMKRLKAADLSRSIK